MSSTPFKMKGSPMQRNFGVGSPVKQTEHMYKVSPGSVSTTKGTTTLLSGKVIDFDPTKRQVINVSKKKVKKKVKNKIAKKVATKVLSRAIPGVGWGLAAYDVGKFAKDWYKTGSAKKAWKKMWK